MSKHYASAYWEGNLPKGNGKYTLKTSGHVGSLKFTTRFEDDKSASSPEELIGAAHAACFSMAFSHALDQGGFTPEKIETEAEVTLGKNEGGFAITGILLKTRVKVSEIADDKFNEIANGAKENCPVSKALAGVKIELEAKKV
ncbi:MAG: OsmC family peroxiredoxin [Bacteroidetes bacterium]|nr:MAG: OsmC family peroxiredoxin [Bacteroidota bacterium]